MMEHTPYNRVTRYLGSEYERPVWNRYLPPMPPAIKLLNADSALQKKKVNDI